MVAKSSYDVRTQGGQLGEDRVAGLIRPCGLHGLGEVRYRSDSSAMSEARVLHRRVGRGNIRRADLGTPPAAGLDLRTEVRGFGCRLLCGSVGAFLGVMCRREGGLGIGQCWHRLPSFRAFTLSARTRDERSSCCSPCSVLRKSRRLTA